MPHVADGVTVAEIIGEFECPLPHKEKEWPPYENSFRGDGGTLGEKLESGGQTIVNKEMGGGKKIKSILRPFRDKAMTSLYMNPTPICLGGLKNPNLPLTCAAHHLIPAQASLRGSSLVKYLYKGTATFNAPGKKGTVNKGGGKLVANVGYDVNGSQNGVWLPGPYALRKKKTTPTGTVGAKLPSVRTLRKKKRTVVVEMIKDTEGEDIPTEGLDLEDEPDGIRSIRELKINYYLLYAISAMLHVKAQYHDAHGKYSKFVRKCLNTIAAELHGFAYKGVCKKCPKRKKTDKLPPPYDIVRRLNHVSDRLKIFLSGPPHSWRPNVWTSSLSLEFRKKDFRDLQLSDIKASPSKG